MQESDSPGLARLYTFFNTFGRASMDRLDCSHFRDMSPKKGVEAWEFLVDGFADSVDEISGLYLPDMAGPVMACNRGRTQSHVADDLQHG